MSLPSGYKRLEYIQSTGTQYIDTLVNIEANKPITLRVVCDCSFNNAGVGNGVGTTISGNIFYFGTYNGTYCYGLGTVDGVTSVAADTERRIHDLDAVGKKLTISDKLSLTGLSFATPTASRTFWLPQWGQGIKLYSCQIYDNGTLVRDFIPCQTTDGTIGLWDDVNSGFYGNAGTGTFTAGPVIAIAADASEITKLKYIQSSGTQYINSNFKANQDTRVVIDFEYISGAVVFGAYDTNGANGFGLQAAGGKWYIYYGSKGSAYSSTNVVANTRLVADLNKNVSTLNGNALMTATVNTFTGANPLIISGLYNASAPGFLTALKIYSCQIYDNGTLVRDYIAAKLSDGTVGLYDKLNGLLYINAGSGTFTARAEDDPYGNDENTLLLLHGEDLTDSSQRNAQITNNGVIASDAQSKFGGKSLYFDGASNIAVNSSDFNFGLGDFTIDCWVRPEGPNGDSFLFSGASVNELFFGFMGNYVGIGIGRAGIAWDSATYLTVPLEEWSHVAVVRQSANTYFFLNGEIVFTCGNAVSYEIPSGLANVGSQGQKYYYKGYIDELRVSNVARWTTAFDPPTEPYSSSLNLPVNIGGTWKDANEAFVNIGGTWKTVEAAFVNIGGTWKELG